MTLQPALPKTEREGYKQTPLGWIPEEWDVKELRNIVNRERPISYGIVQTGGNVENGIKCIRVTDIVDGKIKKSNLITTSNEISQSYKRTILRKGDLVLALRGKIGQIASVDNELVGANLTRGVALIALKENIYNEFVKQQLSSDAAVKTFEKSLNGSALQELSIGVLRKIPIILPPLLEQKVIATVLSTWDKAIETTTRLIEQKQQRKKWLMQQLLTGKKRLKGFGGEWKKVKLGDYTKKIKGKVYNTSEIGLPCITAISFNGNYVDFSDDINAIVCAQNDLLVLWDGENAGAVTTGHEGIVGSTVAKLLLKKEINNYFLYYLLCKDNYKLRAIREGSGIPHMPGDFEHWYIFEKPPIEEQTAIATVLQTADKEIQLLQTQLQQLREQKKGLMQQLLTGKVRVKY